MDLEMDDNVKSAFARVCQVFRIETLSRHQEHALNYIAIKKKDLFVNLPTGYGKSLIFQALPIVNRVLSSQTSESSESTCSQKDIALVISPLTSLMRDQVGRLNSLGISAISLQNVTCDLMQKGVMNGEYSIVFGSPELWLGDERWRKMVINDIYKKSVIGVAVDEAHIIFTGR